MFPPTCSTATGESASTSCVRASATAFNCAVVFDPPAAESPVGKGTFFWDGAAGTWFWVDPTNDIVFVAMIQRMTAPDNHPIQYKSHAVVYGALVDPPK